MPEGLAQALRLSRLGLRVFPVRAPIWVDGVPACSCRDGDACRAIGAHPHVSGWPNAASTDPAELTEWWRRWPNANLGLATGAGSGVIAIDVDLRHDGDTTLAALQNRLGRLPHTVTAMTGGGGNHLLFKHPGGRVKTVAGVWQGVDVRGDGGYIVVEPSLHRSGTTYRWELSSVPGEVPFTELPEAWKRAWIEERILTPVLEEAEGVEEVEECSSNSSASSTSSSTLDDDLRALINRTLPSAPGKRRRRIFDFARALRFRPEYKDADQPPSSLHPLVNEWHRQAFPHTSRTKTPDDSWDDFARAWRDAKHPEGRDVAADAFERTRNGPFPSRAREVYTDPRRWHLAATCRELQRVVGAGTAFSLSGYQAAHGLGIDHPQQAWGWLRSMREHGLIEVVQPGRPGRPGSPATRYRWIGGDD